MLRKIGRFLKWGIISLVLMVVLLLAPVGYVETFCNSEAETQTYVPIIKDQEFQRAEANSYLTYPEWHIVYAYEGLAETLKYGDEHQFNYVTSVYSFWKSFCALNREASKKGGADFNTRATIHTIGVSFTLEMALKAAYEETIGHLSAWIRGDIKTLQDQYSSKMAEDYARFLQQVPWYKYDFETSVSELWQLPVTGFVRGWERRIGLGLEWKAKASYAKAIAQAVAAAGEAQLVIRSIINGLTADQLQQIEGVKIIEASEQGVMIETPRYRKFTNILQQIVGQSGVITEIAGNDEIMLSATTNTRYNDHEFKNATMISSVLRDGYSGKRMLLKLSLVKLPEVLEELKNSGYRLEHIYDY